MLGLRLAPPEGRPLRLLCLGAHSDDLEIGCSGTVQQLLRSWPQAHCTWVVWSGAGARREEAEQAARQILPGPGQSTVVLEQFKDGFFPDQWADIKGRFETLKATAAPDLIFTHQRNDRHQDHRVIAELTWNTWRDHAILEYEIPKYEGDLSTPTLYVPLAPEVVDRKVEVLLSVFQTQQSRRWFDAETFRGLMRLRGVECGSPTGYAEGFHASKLVLT
ncbi:MAG TPA: PIG-L deacetylase family protein [Gemmatimonadales bacterium]